MAGDEEQVVMGIDFDLHRSLQDLEGMDWGEPAYDSSLVIDCHRLHRTPLREFTDENLRLMIGQQIGLRYLVPLALKTLHKRPHSSGNLYEGALLNAVMNAETEFWKASPDLANELLSFINGMSDRLGKMAAFERNGVLKVLNKEGQAFLKRCGIVGASLVDHGKPEESAELTDEESLAWVVKFCGPPDGEKVSDLFP